MKRFAILTEINDCNYGAQLQGFALAAILRTLGAEVEQLNFWYRPYNKALWGTLAKRKTLSGQIFQFLSLAYRLKSLSDAQAWLKRSLRSKSFLESHIPLSIHTYHSYKDLESFPENLYDGIVVGSDQIWNPEHMGVPNPFLVRNLPLSVPRFAYAASIGVPSIPAARKEEYSSALKHFTAISLREHSNVSEIQTYTSYPVTNVLDPTLLLDRQAWEKLCFLDFPSPVQSTETCIYWLGAPQHLIPLARDFAPCHIYTEPSFLRHRENHHSIHSILDNMNGVQYHPDAGPLQFLRALYHTKAIVTDSYHALLFAANLQKPCTFVSGSATWREKMSIRINDFISQYTEGFPLCTIEAIQAPTTIPLSEAFSKAKKNSLKWLETTLGLKHPPKNTPSIPKLHFP